VQRGKGTENGRQEKVWEGSRKEEGEGKGVEGTPMSIFKFSLE